MEFVPMISFICMVTIVHVHSKFMKSIVKSMIVLVDRILVSMEVFHSLCEDWLDNDCLGTCRGTSRQDQNCSCSPDHEGRWCERLVNHCWNRTCQNNGQCRVLVGHSFCECLQGSYSGDECEITAQRIVVLQYLSKSFGFVSILSISCVMILVIVMDLFKYGCGIDPVREERERLREEKRSRRRRPKIERFIYVHQSDPINTNRRENPSSSIKHLTDVWTLLFFSLIKESLVPAHGDEENSLVFEKAKIAFQPFSGDKCEYKWFITAERGDLSFLLHPWSIMLCLFVIQFECAFLPENPSERLLSSILFLVLFFVTFSACLKSEGEWTSRQFSFSIFIATRETQVKRINDGGLFLLFWTLRRSDRQSLLFTGR